MADPDGAIVAQAPSNRPTVRAGVAGAGGGTSLLLLAESLPESTLRTVATYAAPSISVFFGVCAFYVELQARRFFQQRLVRRVRRTLEAYLQNPGALGGAPVGAPAEAGADRRGDHLAGGRAHQDSGRTCGTGQSTARVTTRPGWDQTTQSPGAWLQPRLPSTEGRAIASGGVFVGERQQVSANSSVGCAHGPAPAPLPVPT